MVIAVRTVIVERVVVALRVVVVAGGMALRRVGEGRGRQ
jgi:hypothetical protein